MKRDGRSMTNVRRYELAHAIQCAQALRDIGTAIEAVLLAYTHASTEPVMGEPTPMDEVAFPDDVVYGLGAMSRDCEAAVDGLRRCGVAWLRPEGAHDRLRGHEPPEGTG